MRRATLLSVSLLWYSQVHAQLPYNPTRIISADNGSLAYVLAPQPLSSQFSFSLLNTSGSVNSTLYNTNILETPPFSSSDAKSFTPVITEDGLDVLAGDCHNSAQGLELWRFTLSQDKNNGTWEALQLMLDDASLSSNFLAAGSSFSPSASAGDSAIYMFGGMCPTRETSAANWVSQANYSNTMLTLSPQSYNDGTPYQLSMTGTRAPPIPEAGLTMTPLTPSFTNSSTGSISQQQNFVLIGGHTESAFINMSQVAIFSLPQTSWTFVGIDQPPSENTELMSRDSTTVEPRSGHTAVLTGDGSRIVVFGGWVGDINTPALPQLAILEIGEGYGGSGDWKWTIPAQSTNPYSEDSGVYGHGAAMLPGDVMVVTGGRLIGANTKTKRAVTDELLLLNTTSMQWVDSYINPSSPSSPAYTPNAPAASSGINKTTRTGLGAGLGLGLAVLIALVIFWLLYRKRLNKRRSFREKELRALALGAERQVSPSSDGDSDQNYPGRRSASWYNMQERQMESSGPSVTQWPPQNDAPLPMEVSGAREAERTGALMEIPSPTRGLRRSLHSRGAIGMFQPMPGGAPGSVFRIDEEEESSQHVPIKKVKMSSADRTSVQSDPFKDPPKTADSIQDVAAEERKKEVQGWVEDWQSVAESMHPSRTPSQATHGRTYSNLSQTYANSHSSSSDPSGRGSPEKSDRTGSNLSDRSVYSQASFQRSVTGSVSRNLSQRSTSAGYALFAGAAAAMGRMAGQKNEASDNGTSGITRFPSNRSASLGTVPRRERAETFSSAKTSFGPIRPGEDQALLSRKTRDPAEDYCTPPESPVKDKDARYSRTSSLTKTGVKAMGLLGSVKRVFSGTGGVSVHDRVANFENKNESSSPTKTGPEMSERQFNTNEAFWQGKRGARDWHNDDEAESSLASQSTQTVRRKPVPGQVLTTTDDMEPDDWDVETAVQQRLVQVMFTVPKEKLRVVNADALSLLSSNRSDVDRDEEQEREREVKRMSSVREGDEDVREDEQDGMDGRDGKGKAPMRD